MIKLPARLVAAAICLSHLGACESLAAADVVRQRVIEIPESVAPFLRAYCIACHDSQNESGDRSFDALLIASQAADHSVTLEEVVDQLNLGQMPPSEKGVAQPTDDERRRVVADITLYLLAEREERRHATTALRRLTRYEYKYTIRDLLGIDTDAVDATVNFPPDQVVEGFSNIGSEQQLSELQMQLYLDAARHYLDQTFVFGQTKPETLRWRFRPADFTHSPFEDVRIIYKAIDREGRHLDIGHGEPVDRYPTYPIEFAETGTPVAGLYRIRIHAAGVGRKNPYDPNLFKSDLSVPLKLGLWHVPEKRLLAPGASEGRVLVKAFDLEDDTPTWLEATVWMPAGSTPYVHWINGEGSSKPVLMKIRERYHPETITLSPFEIDALNEQGIPIRPEQLTTDVHLSDVYQGPRVRLFEMTLEGPLLDHWPPDGHHRIFGDTLDASRVDLVEAMTAFASRAFRRSVKSDEVAHYVKLVEQKVDSGFAHADAIQLGFTAILTSPRFLFFEEGDPSQSQWLDDFELASRLSYLFWSSTPDERLLSLASSGSIRQPQVLRAEAQRLLGDTRSRAFTTHFLDAWLRLDRLGSMPPSTAQFPRYYYHRLEEAMKTETRLFFEHVLEGNKPSKDFLDGSYTFANDALASLYGLEGSFGETFQKVALPQDLGRGGLLGHASVMTASANGVETSPVGRGVWVLESLLGTPPSPPPPDVPPIEPDTRGATSIREQLAKHRSVSACGDCHAKIDPWGFALEHFDPIGEFRTHYTVFSGSGRIARRRQGKPVDATGQLVSGEQLADVADLRAALLLREQSFTRNLVHKLLTYATGRELAFVDRVDVDRITQSALQRSIGFQDLVMEVVSSDTFRRR